MISKSLTIIFFMMITIILVGFSYLSFERSQPAPASLEWGGLAHLKPVNGVVFNFNQQHIRLLHLDGCELGQIITKSSMNFDCGAYVMKLQSQIVKRELYRCIWSEFDRLGRPLAHCKNEITDKDLGRELLEAGAVVLSDNGLTTIPIDLVRVEKLAREKQNGIWGYEFNYR